MQVRSMELMASIEGKAQARESTMAVLMDIQDLKRLVFEDGSRASGAVKDRVAALAARLEIIKAHDAQVAEFLRVCEESNQIARERIAALKLAEVKPLM